MTFAALTAVWVAAVDYVAVQTVAVTCHGRDPEVH